MRQARQAGKICVIAMAAILGGCGTADSSEAAASAPSNASANASANGTANGLVSTVPVSGANIVPGSGTDEAASTNVQRVVLGETHFTPPQVMMQSPVTTNASWAVDQTGQAINFGVSQDPPLMTLACRLQDAPPQMAVIRHAPARPGLSALLPVIGNGMRSRFMVDAKLSDGEWLWEATLPADDPQLDVFTGTREVTATLPGGGMLLIEGSRIPGEFVTWCRAGGQVMAAEAQEAYGEDDPAAGGEAGSAE